jgi:hypothetical protein
VNGSNTCPACSKGAQHSASACLHDQNSTIQQEGRGLWGILPTCGMLCVCALLSKSCFGWQLHTNFIQPVVEVVCVLGGGVYVEGVCCAMLCVCVCARALLFSLQWQLHTHCMQQG